VTLARHYLDDLLTLPLVGDDPARHFVVSPPHLPTDQPVIR
jgi:hypothetical protein